MRNCYYFYVYPLESLVEFMFVIEMDSQTRITISVAKRTYVHSLIKNVLWNIAYKNNNSY